MQRAGVGAGLSVIALLVFPPAGEGQSWPDRSNGSEGGLQWVVGSYFPMSHLGSFGDYTLAMDPWLVAGISVRAVAVDRRIRPRFEVLAVPEVAMRRSPVASELAGCEDCTTDSFRLTLVNSRFLVDLTFPFLLESRAYLTGGAAMRFQLSNPDECPDAAGRECALPQFARPRIDPGLVAGLGWEPASSIIQAVQLTGRVSMYGRGERTLASPRPWLPELDLAVRFGL